MAKSGKPMKFAILVTGHSAPHIEEKYGDYGALYKELLEDKDNNEEWHAICVTGSKHDAYAKDEWNLKLQELLRTAFDRQQRILGICFGCQTMAIVLGGRVAKASTGYEGGARTIFTTPDFDKQWYAEKFEEGKNFHLHETHFDIIMDVPPIVTVLGSSKNTPVQMCCVADHFLGLQGHPEFTDKYMEDDLQDRIDSGDLPKEVGEAAIKDLHENAVTDEHWKDMQKLLKTFLKVDHPSANVWI
ncbi:MAG: glutamine amidotransferase [Trebouxia sp. A1-2]|nr:MAG: glutamine amidotransferase [Trebouxia sp. A1-2]